MDASDAPKEEQAEQLKKTKAADQGGEEVDTCDCLAEELLQVVRSKATTDEVMRWLSTRGVEAEMGEGAMGSLKVGAYLHDACTPLSLNPQPSAPDPPPHNNFRVPG